MSDSTNHPAWGDLESAEGEGWPPPAGPRFNAVRVHELCEFTYAPKSGPGRDGGYPPRVRFDVHEPGGAVMTSRPPGVRIRCELEQPTESRVTIRTHAGDHVCDLTVHATGPDDITEETVAIASAIYWSWWRAKDMHGETIRD